MGAAPVVLEWEHFVWALGAMCRMHRMSFDPSRALRQFPPPQRLEDLEQAARALGFQARLTRTTRTVSLKTPCVVTLKGTPVSGKGIDVGLLISADGQSVQLLQAQGSEPEKLPLDAFSARFAGQALLFRPASEAAADKDVAKSAHFGFSWFIPELLRHRRVWREVLLASLIIQVIALITPLLTQAVIDRVIAHQTVNTLISIGIAIAVLIAFTAAMTWGRQYLLLHAGNCVDAVLASRVFEHLLSLPARYFESRPTGTLVARIQGVETIRRFLTGAAVTLILDVPFLAVFVAAMAYYSLELTAIVLALLLVVAGMSLAVAPVIRRLLDRQFLVGARNQAFLTEFIAGIETVKSLQMEPQLRRRYGEYFSELLSADFRTGQLHNGYSVAVQSLEQTIGLAVLCLGAWEVMHNEGFTVGMLIAFQMFATRLSQPVSRLAGLWQEFQQAGIAVARLGDLMNAPAEPTALAPGHAPSSDVGLEAQQVRFRHSDQSPELFGGLDFAVRPGQCIAIVGPSGAGKSTLSKLLQGMYAPDSGTIRINGRDMRSLPVNELRAQLGVVPQDTVLFSGSVYENLALGNPQASFEDMMQACKLAGIHDTIESLPQGYRNWLGEHGTGLSGGQKQRIAIARALLRRPQLLLFDEATSQLDARTAEDIIATVNLLKGRVTIIMITHELPPALHADACVRLASQGA